MKAQRQSTCPGNLLAALCALLVNSCSLMPVSAANLEPANVCKAGASLVNPEFTPGIGGTGQVAMSPGIGGTGQIAQRPSIGGTGRAEDVAKVGMGGTGIVGVVTGFASICVNGVELQYTPSTPVIRDGERSSTRDLLVGQVVAVRAKGSLDKVGTQLQAEQIAVLHAAVGPLTRVDILTGQFEVMGQRAQALEKEDLRHLHAGDWVRVSGLRLADGTIRASLVEGLAGTLPAVQVLGPVTAIHGNEVRVGATPVQFNVLPDELAVGQELFVQGQWKANQLLVMNSALQPTHAELGTVSEVVMQGYVHALNGNELMLGYESMLLSGQMSVSGGKLESLVVNQHVQVRGHVDANQRIVVEQLNIGSDADGRSTSGNSAHGRSDSSGAGPHGSAGTSGNSGVSGNGGGGGGSGSGSGSGGGGGGGGR